MSDPRTIAILADCHIHPARGLDWPAAVLERLGGADLIVTLGDMGEAVGLAALAAIAPVLGVRGADDGEDERTAAKARVIEAGGRRIGCIFDAVDLGLATAREPWAAAADYDARETALFGAPVDILLHAGTHRPSVETFAGRVAINPGSALLPDDHAPAAYARLTFDAGEPDAEIVVI